MAINLNQLKKTLAGKSPGKKNFGDRQPTYKPPKGTESVVIRILPTKKDGGNDIEFRTTHDMSMVPSYEKKYSVPCMASYGKPCEICNVLEYYEDRTDVSRMAAKKDAVAQVIVRKDPTKSVDSRKVHRMYLGIGFLNFLDTLAEAEGEEVLNFTDLHDGRDITIKRKKFEGAFEFILGTLTKPVAAGDDEIEEIMAQVEDLSQVPGVKAPNDNDIQEVKKIAKALKDVIETRILSQGEGTGDEAGTTTEGESQEGETQPEGETTETEGETQEEEQPPAKETKPAKPAPAAKTPPKTQAKASPAPAKPTTATKPAATAAKPKGAAPAKSAPPASAGKKPKDAPECFGIESEFDGESDKCLSCPLEFDCQDVFKKK